MKREFVALVLMACVLGHAQTTHRPTARFFSGLPSKLNEVVPGQVLVKVSHESADRLEHSVGQKMALRSGIVASMHSRIGPSGWTLWVLPKSADPKAVASEIKGHAGVLDAQPVNRVYPLTLTPPNDPDFDYIETDPNLIFDPTTGSFRRCWNLDDVNAFNGWSNYPGYWLTSTVLPHYRPIIAIIDTGCDTTHPDFINAGGTGTDVSLGGQLMTSVSRQFSLGAPVTNGDISDGNGHGTHVTGIAAAAGNNGPFSATVNNGMIGIGYNARVMVLRVFDDTGGGSDADASAAIYYAADHGADIISLSLGTANFSQAFQNAVTYAFQKGSAIFAAGNESSSGGGALGPIYPAACSGVCAVTAAGPGGTIATDYAGSGTYIDVSAPGGEVVTSADFSSFSIEYVWSSAMTTPGYLYNLSQSGTIYPKYDLNYAYLVGTSMACPHVAGAAALYYGKFGLYQTAGWANVKAYRAIERSAQGFYNPTNGAWEQNFGYGELDVDALLAYTDARHSTVGSVTGIVYYNGTPVSNASVKVTVNGVPFLTTTQKDGTYRFDQLPPGVARVTATAFGASKAKLVWIHTGSDTPGVDLWTGTFTGDTTPPKLIRAVPVGTHTTTTMKILYWGYDTENGIDKITMQVGTTSGGQDVFGPREIVPDGNVATLSGTFTLGTTYYVTTKYTNGAGLTTARTASVVW